MRYEGFTHATPVLIELLHNEPLLGVPCDDGLAAVAIVSSPTGDSPPELQTWVFFRQA